MRKKKKNTENLTSSLPLKTASKLKRRQEQLEKEAKKKEKSRNALFRKRVRDASEKKAPKTLRTKAYYRFSSEYPSTVTPDGFRENITEKRKLSPKKKAAVIISCILAFILSFTFANIGIELSKREIPGSGDIPANIEKNAVSALHITHEELLYKTADDIEQILNAENCNTAVFEFKDEYGYVYFDINSFIGASADKKIGHAWDTVKTLSEKGFNCIAYISCFKDTAAASSTAGLGTVTSMGNIFVDNNNSCWLNPFSEDARNYLIEIIKKANEGSFKYIILDNICYPTEYSVASPVYGDNTVNNDSKNEQLLSFINSAAEEVGADKLITLCDISGFTVLSSVPNEKYGNKLLNSDCRIFCLDLRQSSQYKEQLKNCEYFNYIEEMPLAFILDSGALASKQLKSEKEASAIFALTDRELADSDDFIRHSGIDNIIYW